MKGKNLANKFGQRQSQTPFSSTLWFLDQNFILKICFLICLKQVQQVAGTGKTVVKFSCTNCQKETRPGCQ